MPTMPSAPYTVYQTSNGMIPWFPEQQPGRFTMQESPQLEWNTAKVTVVHSVKTFTTRLCFLLVRWAPVRMV
jgi:hypothetical protein